MPDPHFGHTVSNLGTSAPHARHLTPFLRYSRCMLLARNLGIHALSLLSRPNAAASVGLLTVPIDVPPTLIVPRPMRKSKLLPLGLGDGSTGLHDIDKVLWTIATFTGNPLTIYQQAFQRLQQFRRGGYEMSVGVIGLIHSFDYRNASTSCPLLSQPQRIIGLAWEYGVTELPFSDMPRPRCVFVCHFVYLLGRLG